MNAAAQIFRLAVIVDARAGDAGALRSTLRALAALRHARIDVAIDGAEERSAAIDDALSGFAQKFARVEHYRLAGAPVERAAALVAHASGDYVLFLRAGDRPTPAFIDACAARCLTLPAPDVCYAALASVADAPGAVVTQMHLPQAADVPCGGRAEFTELLRAQHISLRGTLIRAELFARLGAFAPSLPATADWEFFLRIAERDGFFHFAGGVAALVPDADYGYFPLTDHAAYFAEILSLYERYVTVDNEVALRGGADAIANLVDAHVARVRAHAPDALSVETEMRAADLRARAARCREIPVRARTPLVSVVLVGTIAPPHVVRRALDSLAAQSRTDFEIVYVRSGGVDYGALLAAHALGDRIRYVHVPGRADRTLARTLGRGLTRGAIVAYLDDEHAYRPGHLESLVERLLRGGADLAYGGAGLCIETPRALRGSEVLRRVENFQDASDIAGAITIAPTLRPSGLIHRARCHEILRETEIGLPILGDWYETLWLISATKSACAFVTEPTYDMYVPVGLAGTDLGAHGPLEYLRAYDAVCARVASGRSEEARERARTRERLIGFLDGWDARVGDPDGLLHVVRALEIGGAAERAPEATLALAGAGA